MVHLLFINTGIHHKNLEALERYKNITYDMIKSIDILPTIDLSKYDCVFSPNTPVDVSLYPNTKFIFGPHFSVLPEEKFEKIKGKHSAYLILSEWVKKIYKESPITNGIRLEPIPFGVNTDKFNEIIPLEQRDLVLVYHKFRDPFELHVVENFLQKKKIEYVVFSYYQRYDEASFVSFLKRAKYGVWVGGHESQGFALEETLASNVPLLVWNVRYMGQEYRSNYGNIPATTIPYWDKRCGEFFYDFYELENTFDKFISNLNNYKPREYIMENLSDDVCESRLIKLIESL